MGFMDKLKFWKRGDELGLGDDLPSDMSTNLPYEDPSMGQQGNQFPDRNLGLERGMETGINSPESFQDHSQFQESRHIYNPQSSSTPNRDMDLISSKLDTIKAELDSINQRLQKIEKIAEDSEKESKKPVW